MRKSILAIGFLFLSLSSCNKELPKNTLEISGNIEGFKKGTIYVQRVKDTQLIAIDTVKINGDSHFTSTIKLDEPEMLYLFIDRGVTNSVDNNLLFFAEPGKMTINTNLDFFTADAKISGSKNQELYEEYRKVVSRYIDADLDLIKKRFESSKTNKSISSLDSIDRERDEILKKKYLYTTNFAVNNGKYAVAPYIALAEISDINVKYLDTIQKSMSAEISKSIYGKKLNKFIKERKSNP